MKRERKRKEHCQLLSPCSWLAGCPGCCPCHPALPLPLSTSGGGGPPCPLVLSSPPLAAAAGPTNLKKRKKRRQGGKRAAGTHTHNDWGLFFTDRVGRRLLGPSKAWQTSAHPRPRSGLFPSSHQPPNGTGTGRIPKALSPRQAHAFFPIQQQHQHQAAATSTRRQQPSPSFPFPLLF